MEEMIFEGEESSRGTEKKSLGSSIEKEETFWPEKWTGLTLEQTSERLKTLGKIWNFANYYIPPIELEKRSEGYSEEHGYLHLEATNLGLTDVSVIPDRYFWLLSIDLSGNRLKNTSGCPLSKLKNLVSLKLNENLLRDPYVPPMKRLRWLEMKNNRIDSVHRIYHPNLTLLDLSYNRIETLDSADSWKLKKLEKLILRANGTKRISGMEYLYLKKLYLAENDIRNLQGIEVLTNLKYLHLRDNPLSCLDGFTENNTNLIYLNIRKCLVEQVGEFKKIGILKGLETLVVLENSFNRDQDTGFRLEILAFLPNLKRIDKKKISKEEYYEAAKIKEK